MQKCSATIIQMFKRVLSARRPEGVNVETNEFPVFPILISLQNPDLIECASQTNARERLVLVELQAILIVQMEGPQFTESHREINFVRWIESGENAVSCLNQCADPLGIGGQLCDCKGMSY